jgi:cytochrome c peroxidase
MPPRRRLLQTSGSNEAEIVRTGRHRRRAAAICALIFSSLLLSAAPSQPIEHAAGSDGGVIEEPITPIPDAPAIEPKAKLGQRLFGDPRLSHDNVRSCSSCHDIGTNGASTKSHDVGLDGSNLPLNTLTVFNATLNFRFGWEGKIRTLGQDAMASLQSPQIMGSSISEVAEKLNADPSMRQEFYAAYGSGPDAENILNAVESFERSLVTPGSRFDRWLAGDAEALSANELDGYRLFKSLGCVSCHQGVSIGGNLFQRHGIFHPLASPKPEILRVPSLRNVAATPPYFHDGSAPTLDDAVRKMGYAQLNSTLTDQQVNAIVAYLQTLTGNYRGSPVGASP